MKITPEITEKLKLLQERYVADGQDIAGYLEGLLNQKYINYWDYIEVDTLLSLQKPRTDFPDEEIFILYHQISELYFKLTLNELQLFGKKEIIDADYFLTRVKRMVRYFDMLVQSFHVMGEGMDPEEFMKFRMSLMPASGFQSVQYRKIELYTAQIKNLVGVNMREALAKENDIETLYNSIYWKSGANDAKSGAKSLTLVEFEKKYDQELLSLADKTQKQSLWACFKELAPRDQNNAEVIMEMKKFDVNVNINWPLAHYKTAVKYLHHKGTDTPATGGTNWQKYLPPRFQKRIFFPDLWSKIDQDNWGKEWVEENIFNLQ
jgi:tryptophan 2,3-dioxygenase